MPTGARIDARIALDTSAYSWFRSGHRAVHDAIAAADFVWVPAVVVGELLAGFELGSRARENTTMLEEFLAESFVALRPVTVDVARQYARVHAQLRRAGTPVPINDVWIAASAIECGARLLTFDVHFSQVAGLEVEMLSPDA